MRSYVAVIGGTEIDAAVDAAAERVGALLADAGVVVITGGRGGVAEAACRGASQAGGLTVGILPSRERSDANSWVEIAIPTGMGETRNALVVMDADAVIAFPGAYGTLIELGFALHNGRHIVIVGDWPLAAEESGSQWRLRDPRVLHADSPEDAVAIALAFPIE